MGRLRRGRPPVCKFQVKGMGSPRGCPGEGADRGGGHGTRRERVTSGMTHHDVDSLSPTNHSQHAHADAANEGEYPGSLRGPPPHRPGVTRELTGRRALFDAKRRHQCQQWHWVCCHHCHPRFNSRFKVLRKLPTPHCAAGGLDRVPTRSGWRCRIGCVSRCALLCPCFPCTRAGGHSYFAPLSLALPHTARPHR
jgi:hypothetical protein